MASHYRLPNLLALFELGDTRTNPHAYELDAQFTRWLDTLALDMGVVEVTLLILSAAIEHY